MTVAEPFSVPFHLAGNYRPVTEERTAFDLPVRGKLPTDNRWERTSDAARALGLPALTPGRAPAG